MRYAHEQAKTYLIHLEGIDGTSTLEREVVGGIRAAYRLAQELAAGRLFCIVRGVEEKPSYLDDAVAGGALDA